MNAMKSTRKFISRLEQPEITALQKKHPIAPVMKYQRVGYRVRAFAVHKKII
jgi:hypothetical protein